MNLLHSKRVYGYISQHLVCSVPMRQLRVALTFDDGPNPAVTPRLLRLLEKYAARATFFMIGRNVERHPELAREIAARGHEIGNHTQNHLLLPVLPRNMMLREMERASSAIEAATGQRPSLFRPPMGWFSRSMLRTLTSHGYQAVLGDVYPQDGHRPGVGVIVDRVMARIGPGSIVILHDGSATGGANRLQVLDALESILPRLRDAAYTFDTVSELRMAGAREAALGEASAVGGS